MDNNCSLQDAFEEFQFSEKDYHFEIDWHSWKRSNFDVRLQSSWFSKENLFRYKLRIDETKKLDGNFGFLAKLNVNRAANRRSPQDIQHVNQEFSDDQFNFTKVKNEEIMFVLSKTDAIEKKDCDKNIYLVNVSPLDRFNCLLCPSLYSCHNQTITENSLQFALDTILLSSSPGMRVGFNSLCGFATVNHLHYHAYYLDVPMKLETIAVKHLAKRCYTLEDFPSKGYVFQITSVADIPFILNDVYRLTNLFTMQNVAHNLYITKGLKFERSNNKEETSERDCVRIYIWARKSSFGSKVLDAFNPALCELFGHLVVKTKEAYDKLDEKGTADILHSLTYIPFIETKEKVQNLFM